MLDVTGTEEKDNPPSLSTFCQESKCICQGNLRYRIAGPTTIIGSLTAILRTRSWSGAGPDEMISHSFLLFTRERLFENEHFT